MALANTLIPRCESFKSSLSLQQNELAVPITQQHIPLKAGEQNDVCWSTWDTAPGWDGRPCRVFRSAQHSHALTTASTIPPHLTAQEAPLTTSSRPEQSPTSVLQLSDEEKEPSATWGQPPVISDFMKKGAQHLTYPIYLAFTKRSVVQRLSRSTTQSPGLTTQ